jgi:hypothetical protein
MPEFGKDWRPTRSPEASAKFAERVDELRESLLLLDPNLVAERSGAAYLTVGLDRGELHIPFWGNICILSWPELTGYGHLIEPQPLSDFQLAFLFHHLLTADGTPLSGRWVSFADLPDGRVYNAAFQGYSGDEIAKTFGLDLNAFHKACHSAGGQPGNLASASYVFRSLPHVPLLVTYWLGDEDFPSSCKILFDESASHYLPIDGCAILGSMLVRKLLAAT